MSEADSIDKLLTDIMLAYVVEAETPPQIVSVPDVEDSYDYLTVCLSKKTIETLGKLSNARFSNPAVAARAILNVVTSYLYQRAESGNTS